MPGFSAASCFLCLATALAAAGHPTRHAISAGGSPAAAPRHAVSAAEGVSAPSQDSFLGATAAFASSAENGSYPATHAIDGSLATRWSSAFSDPQWLAVDLGATFDLTRVVLRWEAAYGSAYLIQVSNDGQGWTTVFQTASGDGGIDDVATPGARGRYVRMYGTQRGTVWGYSLYEIQVAGGTSGGGGSTPFGGTPVSLPGVIQSENFDEGGAGVAYFDTTSGNAGGAYRSTGVDIEPTSDAGGGYNVGWTAVGEWLQYAVNVATAGTYTLEFRVAARAPGATFHLEVNGVDKTGPLTVPNTGSYQTWATVTRTGVSLPAGQQTWRLVIDAAGTVLGNFNYIRVVRSSGGGASTPFGGTPTAVPGTIEAEHFDEGGEGVAYHDISPGNRGGQYRDTDVDLESSFDAGGGYTLSYARAGEWVNYTASVSAPGTYTLDVRVASSGQGGTFHIESNGIDRTGPLTIPNTGGWWTWTTIRKTGISLGGGTQVLRLVMDSNGPTTFVGNINWFRFASSTGTGAVTLVREPYIQSATSSDATIVWTVREPGAGAVRYAGPSGGPSTATASTRLFPAAQTGLAHDFYQHEARLSGLAAATRYSYDVLVGGVDATSGQDTFRTAPFAGDGSVRFIAFGDSGIGSAAQSQLAAVMAADTFDVALHTGDVVYGAPDMTGGGSYAQYDDWFFDIYASWLRSTPSYPSIGNHDDERQMAEIWRDVFVLPEHGASGAYPDHAERFYSFDHGPVHFVALDTESAFRDPARRQAQLAWLEADLAATTQPWRVVYFHRSPYSAGSRHGSDLEVRAAFAPIFERYGVQLVLSGHEHAYERSIPWREFVSGGTAVTYIVTGGGGAALYPVSRADWTATSASRHHYVRVSVDGCTLAGEAVGSDGSVFDTFQIRRCE